MCMECFISFYPFHLYWYGGHSGGATPGLVSIPEVKSSSDLGCTVVFTMGTS